MSDWQPIETAPKDGTHFLAWDGFDFVTGCWVSFGDGRGEWRLNDVSAETPTHWMPLPAPPEEAREGAIKVGAVDPHATSTGTLTTRDV